MKIQPLHPGDSLAFDTPSDDIDSQDHRVWLAVERVDGSNYYLVFPDGVQKLVPIAHKDLKHYVLRRRTDVMSALSLLRSIPVYGVKFGRLARELKMKVVSAYLDGTNAREAIKQVNRRHA